MKQPTALFSMDSTIWGYKPQTAEQYCEWMYVYPQSSPESY